MHVFQCVLIISKLYFCHSWNINKVNIHIKSFASDCSFLYNAYMARGLQDNSLCYSFKNNSGHLPETVCRGKQCVELTWSLPLQNLEYGGHLFLIIMNKKKREILKLKDFLTPGQILSLLHKVFIYCKKCFYLYYISLIFTTHYERVFLLFHYTILEINVSTNSDFCNVTPHFSQQYRTKHYYTWNKNKVFY